MVVVVVVEDTVDVVLVEDTVDVVIVDVVDGTTVVVVTHGVASVRGLQTRTRRAVSLFGLKPFSATAESLRDRFPGFFPPFLSFTENAL